MKVKFFLLISTLFLVIGCQNVKNDNDFVVSGNQADTVSTTSDSIKNINLEVLEKRIEEEEKNIVPIKTKEPVEIKNDRTGSSSTEPLREIKTFLNLPVLFVSQAPFANWDELHEEACEEASMIMADKYFKKESLSPHIMEQGILNLVKWEEENGYLPDLTASETVYILKNYFNLSAEVSAEIDIVSIKKYLLDNKLVIVPAAGRLLGNPNFTGQGPIYHMLIIRGFDEEKKEFITNDPGTRKGEGYRYKYDTLLNAVQDWSHKLSLDGMTDEEIVTTQKVIVVVGE